MRESGLRALTCIALVLLGVAFSPSRFPAFSLSAQSPIRAMSFNIRYGTANDGEHAWPNRRALVVRTIRDHAPHVLALQEALRFQLDELAEALPRYQQFGVGRDDGATRGEYAAVLVDTSRFEVDTSGTFWFSDTPTVPGSASWGNTLPRIATWVLLHDRITDLRFWAYSLHLDHQSQPSRERSVEFLLADHARRDASRRAREANEAEMTGALTEPLLIVMGDFNSDETNPAYRAAIQAGLRSAFRVRHPDEPAATFTGFRDAPDQESGVIDHILLGRGWQVLDAGHDRRRYGALWPSDHFGVWAILRNES